MLRRSEVAKTLDCAGAYLPPTYVTRHLTRLDGLEYSVYMTPMTPADSNIGFTIVMCTSNVLVDAGTTRRLCQEAGFCLWDATCNVMLTASPAGSRPWRRYKWSGDTASVDSIL